MKLERKISFFNLLLSGVVFTFTAVFVFFMINFQFKRMDNMFVKNQASSLIVNLESGVELLEIELKKGQEIYTISEAEVLFAKGVFREEFRPDENIRKPQYDRIDKKDKPPLSAHFSILTYDLKVKNQWYRIVQEVRLPIRANFFKDLALLLAIVFLLLFLLLFFGNKFLVNRIFQPFYAILRNIEAFDIQKNIALQKIGSEIDEFNLLENKTHFLMEKANSEYSKLKEFSENASHELQTPIAIVKAKLDLLLQSNNLREQEMQQVFLAQGALKKMGKLNETLLLIYKIDNNEYQLNETVNLKLVIEQLLQQLHEIIELKNIDLKTNLENVSVQNNGYLIEMLMSNLLSNAIKHNFDGGYINIQLTKNKLTILNVGKPIKGKTEDLFLRFKKNNQSQQSTGLGLAIVHKICTVSGFEISYKNEDKKHLVAVVFTN